MIKLKCDLSAGAENDACCITHKSKGAYCIYANAAGEIVASNDHTTVESNTASFTAEKWGIWSGATETLSSSAYNVANTSINDPFFEFFYCGGSRANIYTCYKYQRSSSTEKDGDPRFDTGSGKTEFRVYSSGTLGGL